MSCSSDNFFLDEQTNVTTLKVHKGCSEKWIFNVTDGTGAPYPLTKNPKFIFSVKNELNDTDTLFPDKTYNSSGPTVNGIDIISAANGQISVKVLGADTRDLDINQNILTNEGTRRCVFNLKLIDDDMEKIIQEGNFDIKNVTVSRATP